MWPVVTEDTVEDRGSITGKGFEGMFLRWKVLDPEFLVKNNLLEHLSPNIFVHHQILNNFVTWYPIQSWVLWDAYGNIRSSCTSAAFTLRISRRTGAATSGRRHRPRRPRRRDAEPPPPSSVTHAARACTQGVGGRWTRLACATGARLNANMEVKALACATDSFLAVPWELSQGNRDWFRRFPPTVRHNDCRS
ncbi:Protein of unknown function [Gryllus bimaculatus]|nr:Protein of unknown function [Gryllus bimaculatus]